MKKKSNDKTYALYSEIELPSDDELCMKLKPILENELKNKNLTCLAIGIIMSILLTNYLASKSNIIDSFLETIPFIESTYITGVVIIITLLFFTRLIKQSDTYNLYEITHKKKERIYFLQTFSKWLAGILSVSIYNIFRFCRFLVFNNNQYRRQYLILGALSSGIPYLLQNNLSVLSVAQMKAFNINSIEMLAFFLPSLLLVLLAKGAVFSSIFSTINYIDKITTMSDMENKSREVFDYYLKRGSDIQDGDFSLIVKGASTGFISLGISKFFKYTIEQRSKFERLNKFCITIAKALIKIRNWVAWFLINYGSILILILELTLAFIGVITLRKFILELINIQNSLGELDLLSLSIYSEGLYLFSILAVSFLLSHSVFKAQLYGKRLRIAIRKIDQKHIKEITLLARKEANASSSTHRRRIGLTG